MEEWPYAQTDRHGNVKLDETRRVYVHVYYNGLRGEEEKARFSKSLAMAEAALKNKEILTAAQSSLCDKYFIINETPKRGVKIQYKNDAIKKHMNQLGYFVLLSNEIKDSIEALEIYRRKDIVEKAFDNLKHRLDMKRTEVHSDQALAGKFVLQFLALIYVSYIHKHMKDNKLYRNYTMQSLLDSLDVIERYDFEGQRYHCSEITKKQLDIYSCLGVSSPNTL
jgi:transposase